MVDEFQSTRPARGATESSSFPVAFAAFQSTRPARGATDVAEAKAIREEEFQSTRPARGATWTRLY